MIPFDSAAFDYCIAFPRVSGDDPDEELTKEYMKPFPRVSGDDPNLRRFNEVLIIFSPRKRG